VYNIALLNQNYITINSEIKLYQLNHMNTANKVRRNSLWYLMFQRNKLILNSNRISFDYVQHNLHKIHDHMLPRQVQKKIT